MMDKEPTELRDRAVDLASVNPKPSTAGSGLGVYGLGFRIQGGLGV